MPTRISRWWIAAAVAGALAVALGAIGAHVVQGIAKDWPVETRAARLDNWDVAARYHMYHALGLCAVAVLCSWRSSLCAHAAGVCFVSGMLLFSGCLYVFVLTKIAALVMLVPVGGVLFIVGWCLLGVSAARRRHIAD